MNRRTLVLALAFGLALPLLGVATADERRLDPEVEKTLKERLSLLQEAAKLQRQVYQSGQASLSSVVSADRAVLDAELELAPTSAERLKVREAILKNAETLEQMVEQLVKTAQATHLELLTARAHRLRAKADLLIEQKSAAR